MQGLRTDVEERAWDGCWAEVLGALLAEVSAACIAWRPVSGCGLRPWEQEQVLDN